MPRLEYHYYEFEDGTAEPMKLVCPDQTSYYMPNEKIDFDIAKPYIGERIDVYVNRKYKCTRILEDVKPVTNEKDKVVNALHFGDKIQPLGVIPQWVWERETRVDRLLELRAAVKWYESPEVDRAPDPKWYKEMEEHTAWLKERGISLD